MKLPDPDMFVKQALKDARLKVLKAEVKSWCFFLVFLGVFASIAYFLFGKEGLVWLGIALGIIAVLIIVTLVLKLVIDKKFRKSFMNYLAMDDYDNE